MTMAKKKIIIGNWKMAPIAIKEARATFSAIKKTASRLRNVKAVICSPFVYLSNLKSTTRCLVGAQDSFWNEKGAYTGEVSPVMIANLGIKYVILGHSERRSLGESNFIVNKKLKACLKAGLIVILCVGEEERDENGEFTNFIKKEITESLRGIQKKALKNLIIAYEPIWAIGKSAVRAASAEDALEMSILIKKVLADLFGKDLAVKVPVLYGGSVNSQNSNSFLFQGEMDGLLVGRASLDAKTFSEILKNADSVK